MTDLTTPAVPAMFYARTACDTLQGTGCTEQAAICKNLMADLALRDVGGLFDRGASGRTLAGCPGLAELLEHARSGDLKVIVTTSLDRLSRNVADLRRLTKEMESYGVRLVTVEEGEIDPSTLACRSPAQAGTQAQGLRSSEREEVSA